MKTLLLLCQNLQEYYDWQLILNELAKSISFTLKLLPTWEFDGNRQYDLHYDKRINLQICPLGVTADCIYKRLSIADKLLTLQKMKPYMRRALIGVDMICSGVQTVFARYLYLCKEPKQIFVSFPRSLLMPLKIPLLTHLKQKSISFLTRCMGLGYLPSPLAAIGYNDYYLTISSMNKEYLEKYGIAPEKIFVIGSPRLEADLMSVRGRTGFVSGAQPLRVCFISQAFALHGFEQAEREQNHILEDLLELLRSKPLGLSKRPVELHIKVHPRDSMDRYDYINDCNVTVHKENMTFAELSEISDVVIASTSTLAFELMAAERKVIFAAGPAIYRAYAQWFEKLGLHPVLNIEEVYESIESAALGRQNEVVEWMQSALSKVFSIIPERQASCRGADQLLKLLDNKLVDNHREKQKITTI